MDFLQRGPNTFMIINTELLAKAARPRIVKSQPFPMASMIGAVTKDPTQEKMFRMKLFSATPDDDFLGMNSVNIVVTILKISMDPTPKKTLATIYTMSMISRLLVHVTCGVQNLTGASQ